MTESLFPLTEAYFSDRCRIMVEVARDTYIGCGLKVGHDGPHVAPEWPPKQSLCTCFEAGRNPECPTHGSSAGRTS